MVERDLSEPERIVGELLQPSGVEKLKNLGLYDTLTGIDAHVVPGYGILFPTPPGQTAPKSKSKYDVGNARHIELEYPSRPTKSDVKEENPEFADRYTGRGLHNGRFLMNLRRAAAAQPYAMHPSPLPLLLAMHFGANSHM